PGIAAAAAARVRRADGRPDEGVLRGRHRRLHPRRRLEDRYAAETAGQPAAAAPRAVGVRPAVVALRCLGRTAFPGRPDGLGRPSYQPRPLTLHGGHAVTARGAGAAPPGSSRNPAAAAPPPRSPGGGAGGRSE